VFAGTAGDGIGYFFQSLLFHKNSRQKKTTVSPGGQYTVANIFS
jgi:hypothetical protein